MIPIPPIDTCRNIKGTINIFMPVQSKLYNDYTIYLQNAAEKIRQSLYDPKKVSHFHY